MPNPEPATQKEGGQPRSREQRRDLLRSMLRGSKTAADVHFRLDDEMCTRLREDDEFLKEYPLVRGEEGDELYIYGSIVSEWSRQWDEEYYGYSLDVSAFSVARALRKFKGKKLKVRFNCGGGSTKEGSAIAAHIAELVRNGVEVEAMVDGISASAALWPMVACQTVRGFEVSEYLVHRSWVCICANGRHLMEQGQQLLDLDEAAFEFEGSRVEGGADKVRELADANGGEGSWLTPAQAKEIGLIDEIVRGTPPKKADDGEEGGGEGDPVPAPVPDPENSTGKPARREVSEDGVTILLEADGVNSEVLKAAEEAARAVIAGKEIPAKVKEDPKDPEPGKDPEPEPEGLSLEDRMRWLNIAVAAQELRD